MPTTFIHCNNMRYKISAFVTASGMVDITLFGNATVIGERQFSPRAKVKDVYSWLTDKIPGFTECVYPIELSEFLRELR